MVGRALGSVLSRAHSTPESARESESHVLESLHCIDHLLQSMTHSALLLVSLMTRNRPSSSLMKLHPNSLTTSTTVYGPGPCKTLYA